jgi:DNA-binding Lrp family transcriptional regulator
MASTAYVLLSCDLDGVQNVYYELKKIDKIIKSDIVYGPYDIIVKINADDLDQIKQTVNFQIKQIQGVKYVMILPLNNKSENIKKI